MVSTKQGPANCPVDYLCCTNPLPIDAYSHSHSGLYRHRPYDGGESIAERDKAQ